MAAMPAETDALADFEYRHIRANGVEDAGNLVAGDAWELESRPHSFLGQRITVTDAAGLHANADVAGAGIGELLLDELKRSAGGGNLHGAACD